MGRRVGHVITKEDRDSRFLCRLRMGLPDKTLNDRKTQDFAKKAKQTLKENGWEKLSEEDNQEEREAYNTMLRQNNSKNYLTIRFDVPGTIVWASPFDNSH